MASESKGISLDLEIWKIVNDYATKENRSLSNAVETLIRKAIAQIELESR